MYTRTVNLTQSFCIIDLDTVYYKIEVVVSKLNKELIFPFW